MNEKNSLSICIPTYNRAAYLREALQSIFESMQGYEDCVEVVLSDNASTDETAEVVGEFRKSFPTLRYYSNTETIEGNQNIYRVACLGTGKYIWVFGDDDKVTPDAIPTVMDRIRTGCRLIICNHAIYSRDFTKLASPAFLDGRRPARIRDHNVLLGTFAGTLGFISSVIMHRDIIERLQDMDVDKQIKRSFPFLYAIYVDARSNCDAAFIQSSVVLGRSSGDMADVVWNPIFIDGFALVFEDLAEVGYCAPSIRKAKNETLRRYIIKRIGFLKRQNHSTLSILFGMYRYYSRIWSFWLLALPLALLPSSLVRILYEVVLFKRELLQDCTT